MTIGAVVAEMKSKVAATRVSIEAELVVVVEVTGCEPLILQAERRQSIVCAFKSGSTSGVKIA